LWNQQGAYFTIINIGLKILGGSMTIVANFKARSLRKVIERITPKEF
jgi:hypothetical protein